MWRISIISAALFSTPCPYRSALIDSTVYLGGANSSPACLTDPYGFEPETTPTKLREVFEEARELFPSTVSPRPLRAERASEEVDDSVGMDLAWQEAQGAHI
jgi:hypothetical protein